MSIKPLVVMGWPHRRAARSRVPPLTYPRVRALGYVN
jgi:hypothetical protein